MNKDNLKAGCLYGNGSTYKGSIVNRKILEISNGIVNYISITKTKSYNEVKLVKLETFAKWARYESLGFIAKKCKKSWRLNSSSPEAYIEGKVYIGELRKNFVKEGIDTFVVKDENGKDGNFHTGSDYFDV